MQTFISRLKIMPIGLLLALISACSIIGYQATYAEKETLLGLSVEYLASIVRGNDKRLGELILQPDYLENKGYKNFAQFQQALFEVQQQYTAKNHPLLNLKPEQLDISKNTAEVIFKKIDAPDNPKIVIDFVWIGTGWLINDDSLFGKNGLFEKIAPPQEAEPENSGK